MNLESLKTAFGDCAKQAGTSKCLVNSSYEKTTLFDFFIFDGTDGPVRIVTEKENHQLIVNNKNANEICLIKTDKCLFHTDTHKKCDCILFNNNKIFLVEIKDSASGSKGKKRKKAAIQLADTINLLKSNNIVLSNHKTEAIICFKGGKAKPTIISRNSQRAIFLSEHNINLVEGNKIEF